MSTTEQINANRQNAQKSTGPKTAETYRANAVRKDSLGEPGYRPDDRI
jgi:hypothetical protein